MTDLSEGIAASTLSLLLSACGGAPATTSKTVLLPDGGIGHVLDNCASISECTSRAEQLCDSSNFSVHERREAQRQTWVGGDTLADARPTERTSWWTFVIECPPEPTTAQWEWTREKVDKKAKPAASSAARNDVTRDYIEAVCALRPGPLRDEELAIARSKYGQVSCPTAN